MLSTILVIWSVFSVFELVFQSVVTHYLGAFCTKTMCITTLVGCTLLGPLSTIYRIYSAIQMYRMYSLLSNKEVK